MSIRSSLCRLTLSAGTSALATAAILGGAAFAQDASPVATPGGPSEGFPVAIHQGSCDNLTSDVAYEIGNAVTFGVSGDNEPQTIGAEGGVTTVINGVSADVDSSLDTLGSDGHAIAVHASPDDDTVIACGNIAGVVSDGQLALAIAPVGDSTVVGVAIIDGSDDQSQVKVYLFDTAVAEEPAGTPAS
jgi:hypothetical protein